MKFNELTIDEQTDYILCCMSIAIRVAKTLPSGKPVMSQGVFANITDRSVWDTGDEYVRDLYTTEQYTICEEVICNWWQAFEDKELWKQMWIICDVNISIERKKKILGISKSYIYKLRNEGVEIIRKYLWRKENGIIE